MKIICKKTDLAKAVQTVARQFQQKQALQFWSVFCFGQKKER